MASEPVYKVIFLNQNKLYELYARGIYQSELYGFIEVEDYVFGERSQTIVDPAEEKLKSEFSNVVRSYIPMHAIVRIDEVDKEGVVKVVDVQGENKIMQFPVPPGARPMGSGE